MDMQGQNTYAPLPFSYLTGGNDPGKPRGFKKSHSQDDIDRVGRDQDPYSILSGQTPTDVYRGPTLMKAAKRKDSLDVVDPRLDVTDPYLLSTGVANHTKGVSLQDLRDPYAEDPRYRDSYPSEAEAGNVFFRSPDGSESSGKSPRGGDSAPPPKQENITSLPRDGRPGYTNPTLDTMTRDEDGQKKLPRFKVADNNGFHYYTGNNDSNAKPLAEPPKSNPQIDVSTPSNPIWDKYYATGGLAPGYEGYQSTTPVPPTTPGVRPTTKEDDFNTLLRNSSSDTFGGKGCCKTKRAAVVTAVLLTALICLGAGFAAGWFIYQVVNSDTTTTAIPPTTTFAVAGGSDTLSSTTTTTTTIPPTTTTTADPTASVSVTIPVSTGNT